MIIRLLLGDQLNHQHSWLSDVRPDVRYVLMEMRQETDYATHHVQKVMAFFAAMRAFAQHLRAQGHDVHYVSLDDPTNTHSLTENLRWMARHWQAERIEYQLPDEYRLDEQLKALSDTLGVPVQAFDTEHFMSTRYELKQHFAGKKTYLMESFYRMMRRKYKLMMDGDQPLFGQWNFDEDNRKSFPRHHEPPPLLTFDKDLTHLHQLLVQQDVKSIGRANPAAFGWPVTRSESLELLAFFVENALPYFGTYQDAMSGASWAWYHSRLSFSLNVKLLSPLEVVEAAIQQWWEQQYRISYAQLEGFVRQIIGWREYMRGVYWAQMPQYKSLNYFDHQRPLPTWFWTGRTRMACLSQAIGQSLDYAYAHHIQRLMLTGNFALLAGIHPDAVDEWYLGIYIDAIEWVEITNTRGMSQFADGGIVGTKPYVSSANYIDKMSHYCGSCYYNKTTKVGERACPFNSLYWHFYERHREQLERNPRIGMMYRTLQKMPETQRKALLQQAEYYLDHLEEL
jgi:deoxyribodipyrimidine photolyase-related protein